MFYCIQCLKQLDDNCVGEFCNAEHEALYNKEKATAHQSSSYKQYSTDKFDDPQTKNKRGGISHRYLENI